MTPRRLRAYLYFLTATIIWGFAAVVIKFTLGGIEPLPFLIYRFGISSLLATFSYRAIIKILHKPPKIILSVVLYSLLSTTFAIGFLFLGLKYTTVLNLSIIALLGPLLIGVGGVIFLSETITKKERFGTAIALLGAIFTLIEPILQENHQANSLLGNLLVLIYLVSDVASIIILKKLLRDKLPILGLTNLSFAIGFITLLPIALLTENIGQMINRLSSTPLIYHLGVWYMALFSGNLAYAVRAKGQKTIEVGEGALFGYLTALFSVPLAVVLLKEQITPLFVLGATIVITGVIIAEYRPKKYETTSRN